MVAANPSEKYEFVNWDDDYPQYIMGNKTCLKPPTSNTHCTPRDFFFAKTYPLRTGQKHHFESVNYPPEATSTLNPII